MANIFNFIALERCLEKLLQLIEKNQINKTEYLLSFLMNASIQIANFLDCRPVKKNMISFLKNIYKQIFDVYEEKLFILMYVENKGM